MQMNLLQRAILASIHIYQRWISPHKGFQCAHRLATGGVGCSGYGKKVFARYGVKRGYQLLQRRFYDCAWHAKQQPKTHIPHYRRMQSGVLDVCDVLSACDGCHLPDCHFPRSIGSALNCIECIPCDGCGSFYKKDRPFGQKRDAKNKQRWSHHDSDCDGD